MPPVLLPALGLVQTALGSIARVPQIILNFKQRHTGNQSIITWGLSLGGTIIRVITTAATVNDFVALLGYVIAVVLNGALFAQILLYWNRTNEVIWSNKQKD
uniref:Mannose-P-dolichol utilization defect 1 protein homolog n=1 Tax=Alexandrium catenella TaxID=2925 RepID=A0A7S1W9U7_ALECA